MQCHQILFDMPPLLHWNCLRSSILFDCSTQCAGLCSHEWKWFFVILSIAFECVECTQVIDPFFPQTEFHSYNCGEKRNNSNRTQIILAILACSQCSRLNICAFKTLFRKFKIDFPLFIQQATRERVYVCDHCTCPHNVWFVEHIIQLNSSVSITYNRHTVLHVNTFDFITTLFFDYALCGLYTSLYLLEAGRFEMRHLLIRD